ncbi:hypothetical protein [Aquabacterium sp.]|uniref:hypothetical protein n=1 Tax=Aquabacterium sp. TaxID=1872578 RepID=UPI00198A2E0B|nr:hypothetical protein [Aquabacterium sp.]MBC7702039.1 hypothetical protein [Aquabacterium sp.]
MLDTDGTIGKLYGAKTTPHLFIVNPEGKLVYKGGIDSIPASNPADIAKADNCVSSALTALAASKKVAHQVSPQLALALGRWPTAVTPALAWCATPSRKPRRSMMPCMH